MCAPLPQFGGSVASVHPFLRLHNSCHNAHCRRRRRCRPLLCRVATFPGTRLISVPRGLLSRERKRERDRWERDRGAAVVKEQAEVWVHICVSRNCIYMSALHLHFIKFQKLFAQSRPPTCQFTWAPLSGCSWRAKKWGGKSAADSRVASIAYLCT